MQEIHRDSLSISTPMKMLITTLSFGLMGSLSGLITGVIDAMRSSGVYVLMSSTSLHLVGGCALGLFFGMIYGASPGSFGVQGVIDAFQRLINPPRQVSDYQRGRVVSGIWLWAAVINFLLPLSAQLGVNLTTQINTPLFSKIVSTALIVLTSFCAIPLVYSASHSGGRALEAVSGQVRHLTSHVPAYLHPILLTLSALGLLGGLSLSIPPALSLIKNLHEPIWAILSIGLLGLIVAAIVKVGVSALTGAKFKGAVSGLLRLLKLGQNVTTPILHLTLAIIFTIYHFLMWAWSSPPEWEAMSLHHAVLVTLFFIPLFIGGEYLKPFVQYSRKILILGLLVLISAAGVYGLQAGLAREVTREALYTDTTSSAYILKQLRSAFDRDGDGVASALGEFDCDDQNPSIYPGAYDIPGNEIDEDCDGFDLSTALLSSTPVMPRGTEADRLESEQLEDSSVTAARSLFDRIDGPHHIVWITLSGFRPDLLEERPPKTSSPSRRASKSPSEEEVAGPLPPITKNLREWASEGLWIKSAYAPTSDQAMGIFSLLTGRYPSELIRNTKTPPAFSKAMRTLPETLERARYQNAAFLDDQLIDESFGYSQGFAIWDNIALNQKKKKNAKNKSDFSSLVEKLDQHLSSLSLAKREYAFVWLHSDELARSVKPISDRLSDRAQQTQVEKNIATYLATASTIDEDLNALRAVIKARETTLGPITVVINGVNGLDQNKVERAELSEDWLKTSVIVLSSEVKPREVDSPTRLLNVTATLLDFAEVETFNPSRELMSIHDEGITTWAIGDPVEERPIYAEYLGENNNLTHRAWVADGWKLLDHLKEGNRVIKERLYWLKNKGEQRDRRQTEETRVNVMRRDLEQIEIDSVRALPKLRR